jgi:heme/copper-type cytochrome/quinol oxidase subunit 2
MDNIIKNPTFIAVVAGVITYTYITWRKREAQKEKKKSKKQIKDDKNEVVISGIVALIVWFIVYGYLNYGNKNQNANQQMQIPIQVPMQLPVTNQVPLGYQQVPTYRIIQDIQPPSPKSFTMMNQYGGGVAMPTNKVPMPDVFVDNFN